MDSEQFIINEKMSVTSHAVKKIEEEINQPKEKLETGIINSPVEKQYHLEDHKNLIKNPETTGTIVTEKSDENNSLINTEKVTTPTNPPAALNVEEKITQIITQTPENSTQCVDKNLETPIEKTSMDFTDHVVSSTHLTEAEKVDQEKNDQDLAEDKMMVEPTAGEIPSTVDTKTEEPFAKIEVDSVDQIHPDNSEKKIIENGSSEVVDMIIETVKEKTAENSSMTSTSTENSSSMLVEKIDNEKSQVVVEPLNKVNKNENASNALGSIASAYDSDGGADTDDEVLKIDESRVEEEEIVQVPVAIDAAKSKNYRTKDVETSDSEDDSSSSSSSSSSDSSSSDSDSSEALDDDDEDEDICESPASKKKGKNAVKEKGEFDNLPLIEDLKISVDEVLCEPLGKVGWMVNQMVVVIPSPGKPTLNIDTVLFLDKGQRVLGRIFDVFGQVKEPHYCVRFNTSEHIKECNIQRDMIVYFVPNSEHTSLVFLSELRKIKAVDEIGSDEEPYFSDDEAEAAYYRQLQSKPKPNPDVPAKRPRTGWKSQHPWSSDNQSRANNRQQKKRNNYAPNYQQAWPPQNHMQQYQQYYYNQYSYYGQQSYQPRPQVQNYPQVPIDSNQYATWYWSTRPSMPPPPPPSGEKPE